MSSIRKLIVCAALAGAALSAVPASAQMRALSDPVVAHPDPESLFTSSDPKLHRNKQAALHIVRELLQCDQWERAGEWLTDRYIQHNPLAASGLAGVKNYFINIAQRKPKENCGKLTNPVVAVQAEGDFVTVLFVREVPYADDPTKSYTTTWFDTWRFVDGKEDEHWDPATLPVMPATPDTDWQKEKDRAAIEELMWNYVRAADRLDPEKYAATFLPDGQFNQVKGRDALHKMIADMKKSQDERRAKGENIGEMRHFMTNQNIRFITPDLAEVRYYWQTVFGGADLANPPRMAAAGHGVDTVVRSGGRWLIKSRDVVAAGE